MKTTKPGSGAGFTLLEVLVAMAIFAVIGLGANTMLRTMIDTHDRTLAANTSMARFARVFAVIERDFAQITLRRARDEYGDPQPALLLGQEPYPVELTKTGWNNPASLPRSNLQRVAYRVEEDGTLTRYQWLVLDRAEDSEPVAQKLLTDVTSFSVNAISKDADSTNQWTADQGGELPRFVEVLIDLEDAGQLRKVIALVTSPLDSGGAGPGGVPGSSGGEGDGRDGEPP